MANDYGSKSTQIRQLAVLPPDQLVDHLNNAHPNISTAAPNIAPHVFSAATNAIQYLNSKLPSHGNELPQDRSPGPSTQEKNAWLDLHKTVSNPVSVLDHVKNGTLNSHHMEALTSVYPDLHQEMVSKMSQHLGKQLPYSRRMAISKFMGQPLDSTMTPESFQAILSSSGGNSAQAGSSQKGPPKKASGVELNQLNKVNELYQTPLQSREAPEKE